VGEERAGDELGGCGRDVDRQLPGKGAPGGRRGPE
jgi:hypothetical protein